MLSLSGPQPPAAIGAEVAVLSAAMIGQEFTAEALESVTEGMFYLEGHRRIFRAMRVIYERGAPMEPLTIVDQLKATNELESVGGVDAIARLIDAVPSTAHLTQHCRIVKDKATLRRLINVSEDTIRLCFDLKGATVAEIVSEAETKLLGLTTTGSGGERWIKEVLWSVLEDIERRTEKESGGMGIPTGITGLDAMTLGLHGGELTVVAARPSMGKTALALGWALEAAISHRVATHIFSLEMGASELTERSLASEGRIDSQNIRKGTLTLEEHDRLGSAAGHINTAPLYIDDDDDPHIHSIMARARRSHQKHGIQMFVLDYLQLMAGEGEGRRQEIDMISRNCKRLARSLNVAVVLLSQLSRDPEGRTNKRPMMSDLRDSGGIEQDADNVVLLYRPEYYMSDSAQRAMAAADEGLTELIVPKQRNGPTGTVVCKFVKEHTRFENIVRPGRYSA